MFMYTHKKLFLGVSSIEILIGVSIAATILISASFAIVTFINTSHTISEKTQALYLAEEGIELARYIRDNDWTDISGLTMGNTYYFELTTSSVDIGSTPETIGNFSRSVTFENVYRHTSTDEILASTSPSVAEDVNTKYITVTITGGSLSDSVSITSILTDINS